MLVLTDFHRSFLSDLEIDKENIFVYPNYLSHKDEFNEPGENYIIYAGRISKQKRR